MTVAPSRIDGFARDERIVWRGAIAALVLKELLRAMRVVAAVRLSAVSSSTGCNSDLSKVGDGTVP